MNHTNHEHATDNDTIRLRDEFNNKLYNFIFAQIWMCIHPLNAAHSVAQTKQFRIV